MNVGYRKVKGRGVFWNTITGLYIKRCTECGRSFECARIHTITCSDACRKRRSRRLEGR